MPKEKLLNEVGVLYSHRKHSNCCKFKYKWYSPCNKTGEEFIFIFGSIKSAREDFIKLLLHWNRSNWTYQEAQGI